MLQPIPHHLLDVGAVFAVIWDRPASSHTGRGYMKYISELVLDALLVSLFLIATALVITIGVIAAAPLANDGGSIVITAGKGKG